MKYILEFILSTVCWIFTAVQILGLMIWHFHPNPIIEKGEKRGYLYKPWDIRLWDKVLGRKRPEYRGIK